MLDPIAAALGIQPAAFAAGLVGALVSLKWLATHGWVHCVTAVGGGTALATFTAPLVASYLGIERPAGLAGLAFLLGLYGMSLADAGVKLIGDRELINLIKTKFGLGGTPQ